jgi:hypothetical protein
MFLPHFRGSWAKSVLSVADIDIQVADDVLYALLSFLPHVIIDKRNECYTHMTILYGFEAH